MATTWITLRWIGALIVAALASEAGFVLGGVIWLRVGGSPSTAYLWRMVLATTLATCLGAIIVPQSQRKVAFYTIAGAWIALCVGLLLRSWIIGAPMIMNGLDVIGSVTGAAISFRILSLRKRVSNAIGVRQE